MTKHGTQIVFRHAIALLGSIVFAASPVIGADLKIVQPEHDSIVGAEAIVVKGMGPENAVITLTLNGKALSKAQVRNGIWELARVPLVEGPNVLRAATANALSVALVVRATDGTSRRRVPKKVRIVWEEAAEDELKQIAVATLKGPFMEPDLGTFVNIVKERVDTLFSEAYAKFNITLTHDDDPATAVIAMMGFNGDFFGKVDPPYLCEEPSPPKDAQVHVGTFRVQLDAGEDSNGFINGWGPMAMTDSLELRAEDIAHALARTAAHELGHTIGLVGEPTSSTCKWMSGCDGYHSCPNFRVEDVRPGRHANGWHIMDAGGVNTLNRARIGEELPNARSKRRPSVFDPFSASFLSLTYPR
jgi:hypothetical protein